MSVGSGPSKEEIFGALLEQAIEPIQSALTPQPSLEPVTVDVLIRRLVAPRYESLADPKVVATMRLLLAEGAQAHGVMARLRQALIEPHMAEMDRLIKRGVKDGTLRRSVATRAPQLILSPAIQAMLETVIGGPDPKALVRQRRAHELMLREWLAPCKPTRPAEKSR